MPTITLTATAAGSDGTIQKVEFFHGGTNLIATVTSAPYTFNWTNVAAGNYSLTAKATDNLGLATTSAPVAITVNAAPTVSLTGPANGAIFTAPATIALTATAADSDGAVSQVEFFQGATLVATDTAAPYSFTLTNVQPGGYTFTARATDNLGASTTSAAVSVTVNTGVAQLYFIHTDHLNTPRVITNQVGQAVWRWDNTDPFGGNMPDENPSGLGTFTCNLRLPGQYFDKETNLHYNYFRDYDPAIGRYVQSDPIGLKGGVNTYSYAFSNPLAWTDPTGELVFLAVLPFLGGGSAAALVNFVTVSTAFGIATWAVANASNPQQPPAPPAAVDPIQLPGTVPYIPRDQCPPDCKKEQEELNMFRPGIIARGLPAMDVAAFNLLAHDHNRRCGLLYYVAPLTPAH